MGDSVSGSRVRGRSRGFFYCSKNQKNPLLPRKQWKVGVVGCGQLTTTIKKNPFWASIYPPPQSHTILCEEVDRSAFQVGCSREIGSNGEIGIRSIDAKITQTTNSIVNMTKTRGSLF